MNSESLLCLASCESVFSYCCPISHIVVNAYCLSHCLPYCMLCVDPFFFSFYFVPQLPSEAILHPPTIERFNFYHIQGCKMMQMFCSHSCPPFILTFCSHGHVLFCCFFWFFLPLCVFSLTFATFSTSSL